MKSFEEYMSEIAELIGITIGAALSKKQDYDFIINNKEPLTVVSNNVGNNKYQLLLDKRSTRWTYYLTTKLSQTELSVPGQYLGHTKTTVPEVFKVFKIVFVKTSFSTIRGLYGMVLTHILKDTEVSGIFGDDQQSTQAISAWRKIIPSFIGIVLDVNTFETSSYDDSKYEEYWSKGSYNIRVGITENKALLEMSFSITLNKILEDEPNGVFKRMYENKSASLDCYLYPNYRMEL